MPPWVLQGGKCKGRKLKAVEQGDGPDFKEAQSWGTRDISTSACRVGLCYGE